MAKQVSPNQIGEALITLGLIGREEYEAALNAARVKTEQTTGAMQDAVNRTSGGFFEKVRGFKTAINSTIGAVAGLVTRLFGLLGVIGLIVGAIGGAVSALQAMFRWVTGLERAERAHQASMERSAKLMDELTRKALRASSIPTENIERLRDEIEGDAETGLTKKGEASFAKRTKDALDAAIRNSDEGRFVGGFATAYETYKAQEMKARSRLGVILGRAESESRVNEAKAQGDAAQMLRFMEATARNTGNARR